MFNQKISEMPEAESIYDGCCIPIVSFGENKKIYYKDIRNDILGEFEEISEAEIDAMMTINEEVVNEASN